MKFKNMKKVIAVGMFASLVIGVVPAMPASAEGSLFEPQFVPVPKNVTLVDEMLTFTSSVNIKGEDVADQDAVKSLKAFLSENGIEVNETFDAASTTLIIGEADDEIAELDAAKAEMNLADADSLKEEGYVLGVDDDTIVIEGKDGVGTYYGVQTLTQLSVNEDGLKAREAIISDEPTMTTRGTIEGFYGTPWTHQDRLDQIRFYGAHKMNTYIYAPKDDPYHREQWKEPYPESEMGRMNELIQTAKENKVDFVFALSPGNSIRFTGEAGEADFQALMNKCEAMYEMGVRSYAIFYDDISNKDGANQAALLNRFNQEFVKVKGDVTPLITVPTEYDTNAMSAGPVLNQYTKDFSETLEEGIRVLWTGTAVVPEGINVDNAQFVKSIYGERIGIWWNYPVTDYITNKLGLGPVYGLEKGLADELDFLVVNPMEHAELSKISIATGADYAWNTAEYDYDRSFVNSIDLLYGDLAPYMYTFANHSSRLVAGWASTGRADAPEVRALMDTFIKKIAKGQDASAEIAALTEEFDNMILAADTLKAELSAEQLSHCSANLDKLKLLGQKDKIALEVFIAIGEGDDARVAELRRSLGSASSLTSGKLVSEGTAVQFVKDALDYDPNPTAGFTVSNTFVVPGQEIQLTNTSSISSTNLKWTMKGANIKTSREENPVISYAQEGIYTIQLVASNKLGEDTVVQENVITVSEDAAKTFTNVALGKNATATSYTGASEAPGKAIDGISSTKWCATGYNRPHTLTIDLGEVATVGSIVISHAEIGGEGSGLNTEAYRVQVSEDGSNYKEVVSVTDNKAGLTTDAFPVSLARYVKLIVDRPTQGGDSAARIYEVEVMGLEEAIELPDIYEEVPVESNKEDLEALIEYAQSQMENEDYASVIPAVRTAFEEALDTANDVKEDVTATQAEVDAAYDVLLAKVHLLSFIGGDSSDLKTEYEVLNGYDLNAYTEESANALANALAKAKEILDLGENALAGDIKDAYDALMAAKEGLVRIPVNKAKLEALVVRGEGYAAEAEKYISVEDLNAALEAANAVLALSDTEITQQKIDDAYSVLLQAIFGLREKPNKDALKDLIKDVESIDLSNYTAETASAVKAALAYANEIFADETADQERVDAAVAALNKAVDGLEASTGTPAEGDDKVAAGDKTDNKAASDTTGSKTTSTTTNKKAGNTAAKTGDGANAAIPVATGLAAVLAAIIAWKKK